MPGTNKYCEYLLHDYSPTRCFLCLTLRKPRPRVVNELALYHQLSRGGTGMKSRAMTVGALRSVSQLLICALMKTCRCLARNHLELWQQLEIPGAGGCPLKERVQVSGRRNRRELSC